MQIGQGFQNTCQVSEQNLQQQNTTVLSHIKALDIEVKPKTM